MCFGGFPSDSNSHTKRNNVIIIYENEQIPRRVIIFS